MDCKYINQNDIHERYLLDRLNKDEKSEYLQHLESCDSCKTNLETEKELLQSIRHFGKSEIKSEIARQVAEIKTKETQIGWDMILKVAAIFFFLVITPGLVFYYQSVESPQILNSIPSDEPITLQKTPKKEKNILDESLQVSDKDRTEEKQIKNLLQSGRGDIRITTKQSTIKKLDSKAAIDEIEEMDNLQGAEDSGPGNQKVKAGIKVQSEIKEQKLAMKSVQLSRKVNNTISNSEDDANSEKSKILGEGISSTAPQKSLSQIDAFQRPQKVYVLERELNRIKTLSSKKSKVKTQSGIKKSQNENDIVDGSNIESTGKSESDLADKSIILNYNINNQLITVALIPQVHESFFFLQPSFPDSFIVRKKLDTKSAIDMEWFVNSEIYNEDPNNILLHLDDDKNLLVKIRDLNTYTINLNSDSTKAILLK